MREIGPGSFVPASLGPDAHDGATLFAVASDAARPPAETTGYTAGGTATADGERSRSRRLIAHVDGTVAPDPDERGRPQSDHDLLVAIIGWEEAEVTMPAIGRPAHWMLEFDTYGGSPVGPPVARAAFPVRPRSVVVLRAAR